MDPEEILQSFQLLKIPKTHAAVGLSNLIASNKQYRSLFVNRRLPDVGWSDVQIQHFLLLLATLDTNNKLLAQGDVDDEEHDDEEEREHGNKKSSSSSSSTTRWCGVGEREGRVYSSLVSHRHFGLSHGMGRSGDIMEPQPKAVGSSVLVQLAILLTLDAIRRGSGLYGGAPTTTGPAAHGILLPLCTGMTMSLVLSSLRDDEKHANNNNDNNNNNKNIVLWSRIDQKSCFKAIQSAGLQCVVVPTLQVGDAVTTDLIALEAALSQHRGHVLAVITTTSCFAPRVPDQVDRVAQLCAKEVEHSVYHIINNAYGLQCDLTSKLINRACVIGRVDAIVCSTDKNFLVPVGGAIVLSPHEAVVQGVAKVYAGRASSSPIVDLFITLLSMGMNGYKRLLSQRKAMLENFKAQLNQVAHKHGERLLECPSNTISYGITLDTLARTKHENENEAEYLKAVAKDVSYFGAMLFQRCVSGTRVIPRNEVKEMSGQTFHGYGSSVDGYPHAYMTAACAIGVSRNEIHEFFLRLDKALKEFKTKKLKQNDKALETLSS